MNGTPPNTPNPSEATRSAEATSTQGDDPLIGRAIAGKFVIERLLGAGAMGAVYRAHQTALERPVAIKVMHGGLAADPTYAARFQREAKAASRLDHPNLIRVLDYGQEADGLLYIVMEYLDGRDLFAVLVEEWPLSHERIVDVLSQTLSALAEAHDAGVLHRDLKPENIMLLRRKAEDGTPVDLVKVCDFGIAKLVEPGTESQPSPAPMGRKLTSAGLVVGTPEYMSPEQARGESFDVRSDLYSVGVILYQLLSRRLPFEGKTPIDVVFKAMHEPPPPLSSVGPTVAPGLEPVCEKAMSKRPEDRFQNAREMRAALKNAQQLSRQLVIGPDGPPSLSVAHAPTQAEFVSPSASTGGATTEATSSGRGRVWAGLAVLAAAAVGLAAFIAMKGGPAAPVAGSILAAPPLDSVENTAPPSTERAKAAPPSPSPSASALAINEAPVPPPTPVAPTSSSQRSTGRRSSRDPRQAATMTARAAGSRRRRRRARRSRAPRSGTHRPRRDCGRPNADTATGPPPPAQPHLDPRPLPSTSRRRASTSGSAKSNNAAATASGNVGRALGPFAREVHDLLPRRARASDGHGERDRRVLCTSRATTRATSRWRT